MIEAMEETVCSAAMVTPIGSRAMHATTRTITLPSRILDWIQSGLASECSSDLPSSRDSPATLQK